MTEALTIALDGFNLGLAKGTGVATYGRNLSRTLQALGHDVGVLYGRRSVKSNNPLLTEIAFFDVAVGPSKRWLHGARHWLESSTASLGCEVNTVTLTGRVVAESMKDKLPAFDHLWNSTQVYERCATSFRWWGRFGQVALPGVDIAHWTYPLAIKARGAFNIYTLHDLVPLRLPHTTLDHKRRYYKLCKQIVDTADHIVTVSEASRQDIINLLGAHPDQVTNTYQSVNFPPEVLGKSEAVLRAELAGIFDLRYKDYYLFFGAIEPKKNLHRMLEAYLGSGLKTPLVIVGAPGWESEEELRLLPLLKALGQSARVIRLEYLPFSLLISVVRGAKATFFPSLYEGFGLPVLESMALGTPVLTSNTSSLIEVAGNAACLVDPYNTQAMAEAMRALDEDDAWRGRLQAQGLVQAKRFNEEAYAQRLQRLYQSVIDKRQRSRG